MKFSNWAASRREYRLAAIIAIIISLLLILLIVAPSWFLSEPHRSAGKDMQPKTHRLPANPAQNVANASKKKQMSALHKPGKSHAVKIKTPPAKKVSSHSPAPVTHHYRKDEHGLKNGYYVQTGAFRDVTKADHLARSLRHAGWHLHIINKKHNLHAVLAGPLTTRKEAERAKLKLTRQSGIKGFIIFMKPRN